MARLAPERLEQLKRQLLEGATPAEVAVRVGVSRGTVERYQQKWAKEIQEASDGRMIPILKAAIRAAKAGTRRSGKRRSPV